METTKVTYSGIGFPGLLTIVFIVLKLTGIITWSWWWVLCPLWLPFFIGITVIALFIIIYAIIKQVK